jgi:hypothetical protein
VEQFGGVGKGFDHRDTGVDAEQWFVGVAGERGKADGFEVLRDTATPCRSEPARDGGVSGDIDAGCDGPIASRLAPTGDRRWSVIFGAYPATGKTVPAPAHGHCAPR